MSWHSFLQQLALVLLFVLLFVAQFDGISWDKGCQEGGPLLNTEWTRIESLSAVAVSCQWNFPILVFQTKRWNQSFKIWWIWTKGKWSNMQRYWRPNARERALFGWIRPHPATFESRSDSSATFLSKLIFEISVIFCHSILVVNLSVRMWTKYMQSGESLKGWLATEYWWGKNGC